MHFLCNMAAALLKRKKLVTYNCRFKGSCLVSWFKYGLLDNRYQYFEIDLISREDTP